MFRRTAFPAALLFSLAGPVAAQEGTALDGVAEAPVRAENALRFSTVPAVSLVEFSVDGPNQRPRRGLRMRFDAATRAVRSLGVEAEDCTSLLRSSSRSRAVAPGGIERKSLGVSFAVNCRFF